MASFLVVEFAERSNAAPSERQVVVVEMLEAYRSRAKVECRCGPRGAGPVSTELRIAGSGVSALLAELFIVRNDVGQVPVLVAV